MRLGDRAVCQGRTHGRAAAGETARGTGLETHREGRAGRMLTRRTWSGGGSPIGGDGQGRGGRIWPADRGTH